MFGKAGYGRTGERVGCGGGEKPAKYYLFPNNLRLTFQAKEKKKPIWREKSPLA